MAVDTEKYSFVWCGNCNATQPLKIDEMKADNLNKKDAIDLLCGGCSFIVATLHERPDGT